MARTTRTTKAAYVNGIQLNPVEEYVYLGQWFTVIEKTKSEERSKQDGRHLEDIYEVNTANMLKKKGLQPVYPSSNDIWSSTTQHGTKHSQHHL